MRRQWALLEHALGSLRRRAWRHVALAVAVALVVGVYGSALLLADALRGEWRSTLASVPDLVVQRLEGGRPALVEVAALAEVVPLDAPGVRSAEARVWGYLFVEALGANVTVVGGERPLDGALAAGRAPRAGAERPECVVGVALADHFAVRPGDRLAVPDARGELVLLEVVGVFVAASALQTADVLVTDDATARRLLALPEGRATDYAVTLSRPEEAPVIAGQVRARMSDARVIERDALVRTYELTFDGRSGLLSALLVPCLAVLLLLVWERLSGLGEAERREIGVLKAVGWETRDVLTARLWESAIVAVGGAWVGALAAYAHVFSLDAVGLRGALFGWSALHPPLELTPVIDPTAAWTLLGVVVVPFVGASIVPAWRAASIDVDEAIR